MRPNQRTPSYCIWPNGTCYGASGPEQQQHLLRYSIIPFTFVLNRLHLQFCVYTIPRFCLFPHIAKLFACPFQVTDDAMQMDVHKMLYLIAQTKCPLLRQQSQKCASLTAIARYIKVISHNRLSTDFQSMALLFKEAWLWSLTKLHIMTLARILPSKACQRDLGTKAANVWDLVQSDRSPFQ